MLMFSEYFAKFILQNKKKKKNNFTWWLSKYSTQR